MVYFYKRLKLGLSFSIVCCLVIVSPLFSEVYQAVDYVKDAEAGDLVAQFYLGYAYYIGFAGVKMDLENAEYWLTKSAEQGDIDSRTVLGGIYLAKSRAIANGKTDLSSNIYNIVMDLLDAVKGMTLPASKKGHPTSYMILSTTFIKTGEKIKSRIYLEMFRKRMGFVSKKQANLLYDAALKNSPQLSEADLAKAMDEFKLMDKTTPLYVPKSLFSHETLGMPFCNKVDVEQTLSLVMKELYERFPILTNSKSEISVVSRSEYVNDVLKQYDDIDENRIKLIYESSLQNIGTITNDSKRLFIISRNVIPILTAGGVTPDDFNKYFKLYLTGLLAKGWSLKEIYKNSSPIPSNIASSLRQGISLFVQNLMCEKYACDKSILNSGLFYYVAYPVSFENYKKTVLAGGRFINYIYATYGIDAVWKIFKFPPVKMIEIEKPERYKAKFVSSSNDAKMSMKHALSDFKNGKFDSAKLHLRSILVNKPKNSMARFLLAVINAREKDFGAAWINSSISRRNSKNVDKVKKFQEKLKKVAYKEKLIW